jgi:hypothetical protein
MADTAVAITAGSGTNIDTRTEGTNGNHRQVVVIGDPATNAGVAPVDATNGLGVDVTRIGGQVPAFGSGTTGATVLRTVLSTDSPGIIATGSQASPSSSYLSSVVAGDIAHDAADSGNPEKMGAKAIAGLSTATLVAAADRTQLYAGLDGALITRPHCGLEDLVSGLAAITDGSSTSVIASAGAGVKNYITSVMIANTSADPVTVDLRDGAAGSVKATLPVPANTSGVVCNFPVPLGFSAATAVCADPSAAASTITVTLLGFKSKV